MSKSNGVAANGLLKRAKKPPVILSVDSDGDDSFSSSSSVVPLTAAQKPAAAAVVDPERPAETPSTTAPYSSTKTTPPTTTNAPALPPIPDSFDIVLPTSLGTKSGDCTILVQIEPKDAALLELDGANGAIGRLEANDQECKPTNCCYSLNGDKTLALQLSLRLIILSSSFVALWRWYISVTLDLKGYQFSGHLFPGPSVMVVTLNKAGMLKVEGLTDEFVHMVQKRKRGLDAVVTGDTDGRYRHNLGRDDIDGDDNDHVRNHRAASDYGNEDDDEYQHHEKQKTGKSKAVSSSSSSKQNPKKRGGAAKGNSARKRKKGSGTVKGKR